MKQTKQIRNNFLDENCIVEEQLPRNFIVSFTKSNDPLKDGVKIVLNGKKQIGDIINDNTYQNDFYRYHDIFHYSFASLLGWSPCTRAMMKCKRKSNKIIDEVEDGARAIITEEAISLIIFNEAKRKHFFIGHRKTSKTTLKIIKGMTEYFEVSIRTAKEWEFAILQSYKIFRSLIKNQGGTVQFNALKKEIKFIETKHG